MNRPSHTIQFALYHSPEVERAYQQWLSVSARIPQLASLPDPRFHVGFFLNEVETRVGSQQAKVGVQQTFPWIGKLRDKKDAGMKAARAAWHQYIAAQLGVIQRVETILHEISYLDSAIAITKENLVLLRSFEGIVRSRYRLSTKTHPQLIRVQIERAQLEDRLAGLHLMRPSTVAALNAELNRPANSPFDSLISFPSLLSKLNPEQLYEMALSSNPTLQTLRYRIEHARLNTQLAQKQRYPDFTIGLDYIFTDDAANSAIPESGDDPIYLSFAFNLPIWHEKNIAAEQESIANRLVVSRELEVQSNALAAQISFAWFEHTDADRRVRLHEKMLIPKAKESLSVSLVAFKTGDAPFSDLLETQRTLLEFSLSAEHANAERGKALAKLNMLVGHRIETSTINQSLRSNEVQP